MQELLRNVEEALAKVGPLQNAKKTNYVFCNHHVDAGLKIWDTKVIEPVENFKYLGSGFSLDSLQQNKKSVDLKAATKIRLFKVIVESVLLYGSEKWTVTKKLEKSVNRWYTRMLWTAWMYTGNNIRTTRNYTGTSQELLKQFVRED